MRAALDLAKQRTVKKDYRLIVLDKEDSHQYYPLLYEVASGCSENLTEKKMVKGISMNLSEFGRASGFEFYKGEVQKIEPKQKAIVLKDGSRLEFKALVLALGAVPDFFSIPGLKENAMTLKNIKDALFIRKKLMEFLDKKKSGQAKEIKIIIGGGGATGVESAAELACNFHHLERAGVLQSGEWSITLVEATSRILGMVSAKASEYARVRLEESGVKVMRDTCIKRVENGRVVLSPRPLKEGENPETLLCDLGSETEKNFDFDVLLWAGGVRANPLLEDSGLAVDRKGRVVVTDTMEIAAYERENIYAIGDCAALSDPKTGQFAPGMAQAAIAEGSVAAKNVLDDLEGFKIRYHYKFVDYPVAAPLGGKNAIAIFGPLRFYGFTGWVMRQLADLRYFLSILPPTKAFYIWFYGAWAYIQND